MDAEGRWQVLQNLLTLFRRYLEPYILPRELYCYLLVVWRFLRRVDPTRTSIPMALRTLSSKLQRKCVCRNHSVFNLEEKMCIGQDRLISSLLDECLWSEKFVLLKWIGTSWTGSVNRIPEVLHRMLQFKFKKQYCPIRCASRDEAPLSAFLDSVFELAVASMDLTRELLHEMMSPWFFDCTNEELRAAVLSSLVRQTQRRLEVENYRSITQILEICVRQFDWPLDLLQEVNTKPTTLLYEGGYICCLFIYSFQSHWITSWSPCWELPVWLTLLSWLLKKRLTAVSIHRALPWPRASRPNPIDLSLIWLLDLSAISKFPLPMQCG